MEPVKISYTRNDPKNSAWSQPPAGRAFQLRTANCELRTENGFTLVETLIALLILTFGLLGAGQLIYLAAASGSLARSKDAATVVAQDKLEMLAELYGRNPGAAALSLGNHGPEYVQVTNPSVEANNVLNRFSVSWTVTTVADPRAGHTLQARQVAVTVTPVHTSDNNNNFHAYLNKTVTATVIFSARIT
jgi:prepilin-type N-terminal cleavage/methylation domain-containing protein